MKPADNPMVRRLPRLECWAMFGASWVIGVAALFVWLGTTPQAHAEDNEHTLTTFTKLSEQLLDPDTDHYLVTGTLEIEGRIFDFSVDPPEHTVSPRDGVLCPQVPRTSEKDPVYTVNEESGVGCKIEGSTDDNIWLIEEKKEPFLDIWAISPLVSVKSFRPKTPSSGNTYSGIQSIKVGWAQIEHRKFHDGEGVNSLDEHRSSQKTFRTKANGDPTEVVVATKLRKRGNANRHEGDGQHFDFAKLKLTANLGGRHKPIDAENAVVEVEVLHNNKPPLQRASNPKTPEKKTSWLIDGVEFAGCFRADQFSPAVCSIQFNESGVHWKLASVIDGDALVAAFAFSNGVDSASLENLQNGTSFGMAESEKGSGVFDEQFSGGFHFRLDTDQGDESAFSDLSIEAGIFEVIAWDDGEGYAEFSAEAEVLTLAMADNADPFLSEMVDTPLDEGVLLTLRWPLSEESGDPVSFGPGGLPDGRTVELEITAMQAVPEPTTGLLMGIGLVAFIARRFNSRSLG